MRTLESAVGRLLEWNTRRIKEADDPHPNPRPLEDVAWHHSLVARWPEIRREWDSWAGAGRRLPRIEELLGEWQGNDGSWRAGLLVADGRPAGPLPAAFPVTVRALREVPDLRSALFSVLDPGAEIPDHSGPNAGVLRYHLGVDCGADAGLRVVDAVVAYRDGEGVLFDDTATHAAWNRGDRPRVTLFCEVYRALPPRARIRNRVVQRVLSLDRRYRQAPARAAEWDSALNPA